MTVMKTPGVYIVETAAFSGTITGVSTAITAFVGRTVSGPVNQPTDCFSVADFARQFGGRTGDTPLGDAVEDFFLNGGAQALIVRVEPVAPATALTDADIIGDQAARTGLYALEHAGIFNLLCIPWDRRGVELGGGVHAAASAYCVSRRAIYIVDAPAAWAGVVVQGKASVIDPGGDLGITDPGAMRNSAVYFPKIVKADAAGKNDVFPACGAIAGQFAATDAARGVWKASAGVSAGLAGIAGLEFDITDAQDGILNPLGINSLRSFPNYGPVIWGARTLRGADVFDDDYRYISVRRLTLYIEESLSRGTKFAVFEPNDETLWSQLRLMIGAFMADLAKQGAFYAYAVTCDATTTTPDDIARGICNVMVQFAPEKPGEFIALEIQQQTGSA